MAVVADTTKVRIFKQITTWQEASIYEYELLLIPQRYEFSSKSQRASVNIINGTRCCWYHKGTNFQANHNNVLTDTQGKALLLIPQRYEFSSKSQRYKELLFSTLSCCWYHKGTNFQANHNLILKVKHWLTVVADTTKVRIFKQITTLQIELND